VIQIKKKRVIIPYRSVIKWLVRLRRSPRAIAGGFALGTFVAFTPTMGIQFFIVMFLATVLNMNRPAAFVTIWITNVATVAPIYTFNYWVGSFFRQGPSVHDVYRTLLELTAQLARMNLWDIIDQFKIVMSLGREIFIPLVIGSIIVGTVAAVCVYIVSFAVIRYLSIRRNRKRALF
jgi:uncharacterized protein (DUF2062 family)